MAHKTGYNVQNNETGIAVSNVNPVEYSTPPLWYNTEQDAMTAATYFTSVTGVSHVVVGPHPRPHV